MDSTAKFLLENMVSILSEISDTVARIEKVVIENKRDPLLAASVAMEERIRSRKG